MTERWHAEIWQHPGGELWTGYGGGLIWPGDIALEVFGLHTGHAFEFKDEGNKWATLAAYMLRRFGPATHGSDPHKDLCRWILTTPDPAVALSVYPTASGIGYSFGVLFHTAVYSPDARDDRTKQALTEACQATLQDLLVPTRIQDVFINALGRLPDSEVQCEDEPDEDRVLVVIEVEPFEWAGCGVVAEYWERFRE